MNEEQLQEQADHARCVLHQIAYHDKLLCVAQSGALRECYLVEREDTDRRADPGAVTPTARALLLDAPYVYLCRREELAGGTTLSFYDLTNLGMDAAQI